MNSLNILRFTIFMPEPKYDKFEEKKEKSKMTLLPEDMKKGILNLPAIPYLTTPHHTTPYLRT